MCPHARQGPSRPPGWCQTDGHGKQMWPYSAVPVPMWGQYQGGAVGGDVALPGGVAQGAASWGRSCSARLRVFPCPPAAAARAWAAPAGLGALGGVCFRVRSSPTAASGCCPFAAPQCVWLPPACPSPLPEQGNQQASALGMFLAPLFGIKAQVGHDLKHQLKNMR